MVVAYFILCISIFHHIELQHAKIKNVGDVWKLQYIRIFLPFIFNNDHHIPHQKVEIKFDYKIYRTTIYRFLLFLRRISCCYRSPCIKIFS